MPVPEVFHHVTLSVTDLDASVVWYEKVLGIAKVAERSGDGWSRVLLRATSGLMIGLTRHDATAVEDRFDPTRVGMDHLSIACPDRSTVQTWANHLDDIGVDHSEILDTPVGGVLVCKDPDGLPLEFFASA